MNKEELVGTTSLLDFGCRLGGRYKNPISPSHIKLGG